MKIFLSALLATAIIGISAPSFAESGEGYSVSSPVPASFTWMNVEVAFKARFVKRVVTDLGAAGPSTGSADDDRIDGYGDLRDMKGNVIGRFDVSSRVTETRSDSETRYVNADYAFGDGTDSFVISGARRYLPDFGLVKQGLTNVFPVAGGTGAYASASGQCSVLRTDLTEYNVTCALLVPKR